MQMQIGEHDKFSMYPSRAASRRTKPKIMARYCQLRMIQMERSRSRKSKRDCTSVIKTYNPFMISYSKRLSSLFDFFAEGLASFELDDL